MTVALTMNEKENKTINSLLQQYTYHYRLTNLGNKKVTVLSHWSLKPSKYPLEKKKKTRTVCAKYITVKNNLQSEEENTLITSQNVSLSRM